MNFPRTLGFRMSLVVLISVALWLGIIHLTHIILERVIV